ncbi:MAG: ATP-binding cassette domain-containing protein [Chitinophagaceae bacterium]|nr:ATP-binding cassette domain-containing protein [Chitinophagaceae bacterium]
MALPFLALEQLTVKLNGKLVLDNISLTIHPNECWAITGISGSGKTTLANTIAGRHFFGGNMTFPTNEKSRVRTVVIHQQHRFKNLSNTSDFYYQQRYNSSDSEDAVTVSQALGLDRYHSRLASGIIPAQVPGMVHIESLLEKPLIQLSNGENKRLQIAKAILQEPELMILDNPFTGLDTEGRKMLNSIISMLAQSGIQIIIITSPKEIPDAVTHVAVLENGKLIKAVTRNAFNPSALPGKVIFRINPSMLASLNRNEHAFFDYAVRMRNVNVHYGNKQVLKNINWNVKKGEHWSISGPNGAGKSTLLSLLTGDNAKAYANEIYLFDKRRGSGESIWDIKKKIGYVSPEMHLYFDYTASCFETIASGLFDSIGLFRKLNDEQHAIVLQWIKILRIEAIQHKALSTLSAGEQRLVLLGRALVKNPPLLILDEPCQGLDAEHVEQFRLLIDDICGLFDTTLLYVSHYRNEIPLCVTRFLRIENGEGIIEQGSIT